MRQFSVLYFLHGDDDDDEHKIFYDYSRVFRKYPFIFTYKLCIYASYAPRLLSCPVLLWLYWLICTAATKAPATRRNLAVHQSSTNTSHPVRHGPSIISSLGVGRRCYVAVVLGEWWLIAKDSIDEYLLDEWMDDRRVLSLMGVVEAV